MKTEELVQHVKRLIDKPQSGSALGLKAEAIELLRVYAGVNSQFYKAMNGNSPSMTTADYIRIILTSFVDYLEAGLVTGVSPERQAQLDVVSDLLEMASCMLNTSGFHPVAATVVIGATLEEFLRNWVEAENLDLGNKKPGLDTYAQLLREKELITKQDAKDILVWAGLRNHAAHGEWDEVADKRRIALMLEGVNLFLRKYIPA